MNLIVLKFTFFPVVWFVFLPNVYIFKTVYLRLFLHKMPHTYTKKTIMINHAPDLLVQMF